MHVFLSVNVVATIKAGIIGERGAGKTTLFRALTGLVSSAGYPGEKQRARVGQIKVPDSRLDFLAAIYQSQKKVQVEISLLDFAPASVDKHGKGVLDGGLMPMLRELDALLIVIPGFREPPPKVADVLEGIETELILADVDQAERRLTRIKKERGPNEFERTTLEKCLDWLNSGRPLRTLELSTQEAKAISHFCFLSRKPALGVLNYQAQAPDEAELANHDDKIEAQGLEVLPIDALFEAELWELEPAQRLELLKEAGLNRSARERLIEALYHRLQLITFYTAGPKEARAWTLSGKSTALDAAGQIHSDMARGFIRAEVISFGDMERFKSEAGVREAGKLRLESRDYIVQDGDIIRIRFKT